MSKIQVVVCNTCNTEFAACIEKHIDGEWLRSCAKYIKNGSARIESVDSVTFDKPLNPCCGKTLKAPKSKILTP